MKEMTIKEVQQVSLEILKDVHEFCVKNNIKYSLSGGTLLGAIRHNGFIPWDDDIDIQMTRPEYEKFIHSYKSAHGYKLFSREIDGGENVGIAFSRVCEMKLTSVEFGSNMALWTPERTGLWIDIFPIDGAPETRELAKKKIAKMYFGYRLISIYRTRIGLTFKKSDNFLLKTKVVVKRFLTKFLTHDFVIRYIMKSQEYKYENSKYLANYSTMHYKMKEWQPKESMSNYIFHKFEDGEFMIMEGYKISLSSLYGDYMTLPPIEQQKPIHESYSFYWR